MTREKGKQPDNLKNRKPLDMPTRERLLALIRILQSFDESNPLSQVELPEILGLFYYNYIFRECMEIFESCDIEDKDEALSAASILINRNNEEIVAFIILDDDSQHLYETLSYDSEYDYLNDLDSSELVEIITEFAEDSDIDSEFLQKKIVPTLKLIKDDIDLESFDNEKKNFIGQATLTKDLRTLSEWGVLKRSNKRKMYGLSARKSLDLWQLKLIYESVNSIRFLSDKERQDILDSILFVTSKAKHDQSVKLCHPLDPSLYSRTSTFSDNLQKLLEIQLRIIEKEKNNPQDVASSCVRFQYRHSRIDRTDREPDKPSPITCFPIDIVAKDGFFYLLGVGERGVTSYRVDRIVEPEYVDMNFGYTLLHPEYSYEKEMFFKNNTNNFPGGDSVDVVVKWDFEITRHYTALFDVFGYENISQGPDDDLFIIKTRDNYGMYLNLLRLGPVIEVIGPPTVRDHYAENVRSMYLKLQ